MSKDDKEVLKAFMLTIPSQLVVRTISDGNGGLKDEMILAVNIDDVTKIIEDFPTE